MWKQKMSSSGASDLSLTAAKAKFFEATRDERIVQIEHKILVRNHINEAISCEHRYTLYEVPATIPGVYIEYNVMEITLWLIRTLRKADFTVQLITTAPPTIRIEGWCSREWIHDHRPDGASDDAFVVDRRRRLAEKPPARAATLSKRPSTKITPEDASRRAQRGFSKTLRERFDRTQRHARK